MRMEFVEGLHPRRSPRRRHRGVHSSGLWESAITPIIRPECPEEVADVADA